MNLWLGTGFQIKKVMCLIPSVLLLYGAFVKLGILSFSWHFLDIHQAGLVACAENGSEVDVSVSGPCMQRRSWNPFVDPFNLSFAYPVLLDSG